MRLTVGPLVQQDVVQTEIGRQVDHLGPARQLADDVLGGPVRQAAENDIEGSRVGILDLGERRQRAAREMRKDRGDRLPGVAVRGHAGDAHGGVILDQAQELDPGVAGRTQDPDAHAVGRHRFRPRTFAARPAPALMYSFDGHPQGLLPADARALQRTARGGAAGEGPGGRRGRPRARALLGARRLAAGERAPVRAGQRCDRARGALRADRGR